MAQQRVRTSLTLRSLLAMRLQRYTGGLLLTTKQQEEENNGNTITVNSKLLEMVVVELETGTGKCCNYREAKIQI